MSWGVCAPARQQSRHLYQGRLVFELALLCVLWSCRAVAIVVWLLLAPAVPGMAAGFANEAGRGLRQYGAAGPAYLAAKGNS
jgi:hypothetical protein